MEDLAVKICFNLTSLVKYGFNEVSAYHGSRTETDRFHRLVCETNLNKI